MTPIDFAPGVNRRELQNLIRQARDQWEANLTRDEIIERTQKPANEDVVKDFILFEHHQNYENFYALEAVDAVTVASDENIAEQF